MKTPEKVPSVHLWGDSDAPWRCVAAAIYNVTSSGYPRIGLISGDVEGVPSTSVRKVARAVYFEPPFYDRLPEVAFHKVEVTSQDGILWDGGQVTFAELNANLLNLQTSGTEKTEIEFKPDANASYAFSAQIIRTIQSAGTAHLRIVGAKEHCSADSQYVKDSGRCARRQDGS